MEFWHNGILTADIDKTIDFMCAASGAARDKWIIMDAVEFPQSNMVCGDGGKLRVAAACVGGAVVELIQPLDDCSYHAKSLKARGPGFHHSAHICEDGMDELVAALVAAGGRIVWDFKNGDEHACYVEAPDGSAILEIINCCPFMPEE